MKNAITTQEAADLLGVTPRRVVALLRGNRIAGRLIGRQWFVDRASVARFERLKPGRKPA